MSLNAPRKSPNGSGQCDHRRVCLWVTWLFVPCIFGLVGEASADLPILRIDDYEKATCNAIQSQSMLLVSIEPNCTSIDADDVVGQWLDQEAIQKLFLNSQTPWIFCRIAITDTIHLDGSKTRLVDHPSLAELRHGPGIFVVDYAHDDPAINGRIVSILPRTPGKFYQFSPSHMNEIATLPPGTLTQRSMILAVRIHPEHPKSILGTLDPILVEEAQSHSLYQAQIGKQGHHNWHIRSRRILSKILFPGSHPTEIVAQSWEHQDLLDSCVDCVHSWRHSPGHWNAVKSLQTRFGYDIRRGKNNVWYATGIMFR